MMTMQQYEAEDYFRDDRFHHRKKKRAVDESRGNMEHIRFRPRGSTEARASPVSLEKSQNIHPPRRFERTPTAEYHRDDQQFGADRLRVRLRIIDVAGAT